MTPSDKRLLRNLLLAVLIKLVVLGALWWLFIRDAGVGVDDNGVAERLIGTTSSQGAGK